MKPMTSKRPLKVVGTYRKLIVHDIFCFIIRLDTLFGITIGYALFSLIYTYIMYVHMWLWSFKVFAFFRKSRILLPLTDIGNFKLV